MKCGLDVGSTLIKAALYNEEQDSYCFLSTRTMTKEQLTEALQEYGVTEVFLTGVGQYDLPFHAHPRHNENAIQAELELQAKGVRKLMEWDGATNDNFGMVAIGTGTSYTHVTKDGVQPMMFGNFIGGGFLLGISAQLPGMDMCADNERRLTKLDAYAKHIILMSVGNPADLLIKDMLPTTKGSSQGEFLISSCGKLSCNSDVEDVCFGLVNCVAASVMRDVIMYQASGQLPIDNIVLVGSTIVSVPTLGTMLENYGKLVGLKVKVPSHADFAGAVGALIQLGV